MRVLDEGGSVGRGNVGVLDDEGVGDEGVGRGCWTRVLDEDVGRRGWFGWRLKQ
jgi:hypothetical protein